MRQKFRILYKKCFNLLSLQIFFGFTFNITSTIFKAKTWERKLFCCQINQSRVLFSEINTKVHSYFLPYVLLIMWQDKALVSCPRYSVHHPVLLPPVNEVVWDVCQHKVTTHDPQICWKNQVGTNKSSNTVK